METKHDFGQKDLNSFSGYLVIFGLAFTQIYTVMILNHSNRIAYLVWLILRPPGSGFLAGDLTLYPDFSKTA